MRNDLRNIIMSKKVVATVTAFSVMLSSVPVSAKGTEKVERMRRPATKKVVDIMSQLTSEDYVEGEVVVTYKNTNGADVGKKIAKVASNTMDDVFEFEESKEATGLGAKRSLDNSDEFYITTVKSETQSTEELIESISAIDGVICVEPNIILKVQSYNDEYYRQQWSLKNNYETYGTKRDDINFESVKDVPETNDEKIIAILDTGVDYTHEELENRMWINPYDQTELEGIYGYDYGDGDDDPMDYDGHGTHCAGIMVAEANNNQGIVGIASRENIKLMALKIFGDDGSGTLFNAVAAYNYIYKAQSLGANIVAVNNSWEGSVEVETLDTLIELVGNNGALSVCSTGNMGEDSDYLTSIPANYESDYIISVAAADELGKLAPFSNYGKNTVDLAAPGSNILSTVPYYTFTPSIYENPEEICQRYDRFDSDKYKVILNEDGYTGEVAGEGEQGIGLVRFGDADISISKGYTGSNIGSDYEDNSCLKWEIKNAGRDEDYILVIPYSVLASDEYTYQSFMYKVKGVKSSYYYASMCYIYDAKFSEFGAYDVGYDELIAYAQCNMDEWWQYTSGAVSEPSSTDSERALYIEMYIDTPGDYEVYIDNLAISKQNVSEYSFAKYDYMSGASMACPQVTAAVAIASEMYPEDNALELKNRIMASVEFDDSLKGKTVTGGRLDLSKLDKPETVVSDISFVKNGVIQISGYNLSEAEVMVDGTMAKVLSHSANEIQIDAEGIVNQKLKVELLKGGEIIYSDYCSYIDGKMPEYHGEIEGSLDGDNIASDGNNLWYLDNQGNVCKGTPVYEDDSETIEWVNCNSLYGFESVNEELFGYTEMDEVWLEYYYSKPVCNNDSLYVVARSLDYMTGECRYRLLSFDLAAGWKVRASLSEDEVGYEFFSLFAYNNNIYVISGVQRPLYKFSTKVYKYIPDDVVTDGGRLIVADDIPSLPEARGSVRGVQVGNKLVLTLGTDGTTECPNNLIFDGTEWKVSKDSPEIDNYSTVLFEATNVYEASVSAVKNGIIYSGAESRNCGNIFMYDVDRDEFVCTEYETDFDEYEYENIVATTVGERLYILADSNVDESTYELYGMPVESGYLYVDDCSEKGAKVNGADRYYLYSDKLNLTGEVEDGCFLKNMTVNGDKVTPVNGKVTFSGLASAYDDALTVKVNVGKYVTNACLRDYEIITLSPGDSIKLQYTVLPEDADNKNVYLRSRDVSLIKITDRDVVHMSEGADLGEEAYVDIVSDDRNKVVGTFIVKCSDAPNKPIKIANNIEINGYQISSAVGGFRVVYSVNTSSRDVREFGVVYGLLDYCDESELRVDSDNPMVYAYEATNAGKSNKNYSSNRKYDSYAMTMKFINTAEFFNSKLVVRAYVRMKDGSYRYTPVETFSVYDIAEELYINKLMPTESGHKYLYDGILSIADMAYPPIEYNWRNSLVQ